MEQQRPPDGRAASTGVAGSERAKLTPRPFERFRRVRVPAPAKRTVGLATDIPERRFNRVTERRDATYRRCLALADVIAAAIAVYVAVPLIGDDSLNPLALFALPMIMVLSKLTDLYDRDEVLIRKGTLDEVPLLFRMATLYTLVLWLAGDLIVEGHFEQSQVLCLWALLLVATFAARVVARRVARELSEQERCLLVGGPDAIGWIESRLAYTPGLKVEVVGRLPLHSRLEASPLLRRKDEEAIERATGDERADRVIIASDGGEADDLLDTIRHVKSLGVKVSVMPRMLEVIGSTAERDEIDGATLLGMRRHGLTRSSRAIKRCLDLVLAGTGLLLIAPLLALIAIAIKLDSPGPVLFRQKRVGLADAHFEMLKFRTMIDGAESARQSLLDRNEAKGGLFKIEDDPRITRVGQLLRRTSLDELPQLFNVIRGEMSLVGPRPLVLCEDSQITGWRRRRLNLPPGMTGLWQIFGSARIPMEEMLKIDYTYGANWSLWLDVKILLRTIPVVFGARGL